MVISGLLVSEDGQIVEIGRRYAAELVGLEPDIIVAAGDSNTGPLQDATRTVLIVLPNGVGASYRELVIALAARHRLPAVYPFRFFVLDGGLISYGPDDVDQLNEWPVTWTSSSEARSDLPVQNP